MQVAVMGFGTVGSGVVELILKNKQTITSRSGQNALDVKHILDIRDFPGHRAEKLITKNFDDILNDFLNEKMVCICEKSRFYGNREKISYYTYDSKDYQKQGCSGRRTDSKIFTWQYCRFIFSLGTEWYEGRNLPSTASSWLPATASASKR